MSDLIERLRKHGWDNAADRIEELEKRLKEHKLHNSDLAAENERLREALDKTTLGPTHEKLRAENERLRDALIEITKFDPDFYNLAIQIALAALEDSDDE
jgi:regulator of replication initiation timing